MARIGVPNTPYQPAPTVQPEGRIPDLRVQATPQMFGAGVGQALEHFGGAIEHAGNALWNRAVEVQQDKNAADARDAVNNYLTEQGKKQEEFQTKLGKDAVDSMGAHVAGINSSREALRKTLTNPDVRRRFDSEVAPAVRTFITHSYGHAATEQKKYELGTLEAGEKLDEERLERAPMDPTTQDDIYSKLKDNAHQIGVRRGWGEKQEQLYVDNRKSALKLSQVKGLSQTDPMAAEKFLKDGEADKSINNKDANAAHAFLDPRVRQVVARDASTQTNAHPEDVGNAPWWTPKELEINDAVDHRLGLTVRELGKSHPELRATPTAGTKDSVDFAVKGDAEKALPLIEEAAQRYGYKITSEVKDGRVSIKMAADHDTKNEKTPQVEAEASRAGRAASYTAETRPGDPDQHKVTMDRATTEYKQIQSQHMAAQHQMKENVTDAVYGDGGEIGPAKSIEEALGRLQAKYGNSNDWDKLDPVIKKSFIKDINRVHKIETSIEEYNNIMGMVGDKKHGGTAEFLALNIPGNDNLSDQDKKAIIREQARVRKEPGGNADVNYATDHLQGKLRETFVWEDKNELWKFRGYLQEALVAYRAKNKERMPDEEIDKLGAQLLFRAETKGWFGFTSKDVPYFKGIGKTISEQDRATIINAYRKANDDRMPDEQDIILRYLRGIYTDLYGK